MRTLEAPRGFQAQGACLRPAHSLVGLDVGFLLPRPSCVTLNQAESSSLRSVPALRFLIWGHLETCKGADEFGSKGGERPPAGRWVEADPGGRTHRERGEDSHPPHHCHILGQLGKSRCIRWQIPSGKPPTPSLPPARPGNLAEGQRPRGWLRGQVCCLWFRTRFTPQSPRCSSWNCEAPVRVAEMSAEEMVDGGVFIPTMCPWTCWFLSPERSLEGLVWS